jgi:hypothetical protein
VAVCAVGRRTPTRSRACSNVRAVAGRCALTSITAVRTTAAGAMCRSSSNVQQPGAAFAMHDWCRGPRCSLIAWTLSDRKISTEQSPLRPPAATCHPTRRHRSIAVSSASESYSRGATSMKPTTSKKLAGSKSCEISFAARPHPSDLYSRRASASSGSVAMPTLAANYWPRCLTGSS